MNDDTSKSKTSAARKLVADLIDKGVSFSYANTRDSIKAFRLINYTTQNTMESSVIPAVNAVLDMNQTLATSLIQAVRGDKKLRDFGTDTYNRVRAAARFSKLVKTMGKELFASAVLPGETILAEDEYSKLTYIPPKEGVEVQPIAVFHAGGGIPYSDRIFRMLPESNFYERFTERGIAVYAMELRGDRFQVNYSGMTVEKLIDAIERFSTIAFDHNGKKKMILEGYCGHGMQSYAYVCAKPADADSKFKAVATFVAPVDGTECSVLSEFVKLTPEKMLNANLFLFRLLGGYVPGDNLRMSLDLSLKTTFYKTPLGYIYAGFNQASYANVKTVADLTATQRRDLAGAYWISPQNSSRFPLSVDLVKFSSRLFSKGIAKNGDLPWEYKGKTLSFKDALEQTSLQFFGFFGGRDVMVPDRSAFVLIPLMGKRYTHVVHPGAGHISYVLSPKLWDTKDKQAMVPNPITLLLDRCVDKAASIDA